ncbi:hypothetical protein XENORESO_016990 [Xenotaenia resolanae]|uniref:Uncharacterized protein n=1 Tax=Xenotaenia resolanae TaxID=208358 RepID=A0ABV0VMY3_9TELE
MLLSRFSCGPTELWKWTRCSPSANHTLPYGSGERFYDQHAEEPVWLAVRTSPVWTCYVTTPVPGGLNVSQHGSIFIEWPHRSLWTSRTPVWTSRLGNLLLHVQTYHFFRDKNK